MLTHFVVLLCFDTGRVVVTESAASLWTDGQYFLQAEQEMDCDWILMRMGIFLVIHNLFSTLRLHYCVLVIVNLFRQCPPCPFVYTMHTKDLMAFRGYNLYFKHLVDLSNEGNCFVAKQLIKGSKFT